MVCLTTFGDTKWVISQSLIIFHTFYGYVQGRGVLSRGSAYLPPHSLHTSLPPHGSESSPFTQPGSLPNSSRSVIYFLWSDADFLISPAQPPASNCTEDNPGLPRCGAGERPFFLFRWDLETFLCPIWRGKKNRRWNKGVGAQAPSAVADWLQARASCSQAANPISEYSVCDIYSNALEIRIV